MAADKEWSEDPADDPVELQKQQLAIGREFLSRLKAQEEAEKARRDEYAARPLVAADVIPYKPPTFEEVSAVLKKSWSEVEKILPPTAGDQAKAIAFQMLISAAAPRHSFGG